MQMIIILILKTDFDYFFNITQSYEYINALVCKCILNSNVIISKLNILF